MNSEPERSRRIDAIALAFETEWHIDQKPERLVDFYASFPSDELLSYLIAADCELARNLGAVRDCSYYTPLFPDKHVVIQSALCEDDPNDDDRTQKDQSDSYLETYTQFFLTLPCAFGKYRVVRCIGQGGMAAIFEAEIDNRTVALKLPYQRHRGARRFNERFQQEIRLLSNLSHPNIVPIIESGTIDGLSYYTMLRIDGEGLNKKCTLDRFESLSPRKSAAYMLQATQAIAYSHSQGIRHRDVKPSNILVDCQDHVWVVDFGLATISDANPRLTGEGRLLGTPTWMSPEQARGEYDEVDERSDIYSLGATLYTLLTGRAPFVGASTDQVLQNIQCQELIPPRHLVARVPHQLQNIVLKCMEKNPSRRYANAHDLADDINAYLSGGKVRAKPPAIPIRLIRWCKLYPRWSIGVAATLVTLMALIGATLVFQQIAQLQKQIAANALASRDTAFRSEVLQKQLRVEADFAKRKAEDATNYAEAQQLRTAFAGMEMQLRLGQQSDLDYILLYPARYSFDTHWFTQFQKRRPSEVQALCTGNWGHYDVAFDRQNRLLATAGREGDVAIWDLKTESLKKYCRFAERDPDKGFPWIRWRYDFEKTDGFTPRSPPEFFSSLSWTNQGNLLATGLNGELVEFHSDEEKEPRALFRSPRPLHFVRANESGEQFIVVDAMGKCTLLSPSGIVQFESELEFEPSWARFAKPLDAWSVASVSGELVFLDARLQEQGRLSTGSRIHDVRIDQNEAVTALITSEGKPLQHYQIQKVDDKLEFKLIREFMRPSQVRSQGHNQALIDTRTQQVIALDDNGDITTWDLTTGSTFEFNELVAKKDVRHPYPEEVDAYDSLESRSRGFLWAGESGPVTIDNSGTLREFDFADLHPFLRWERLAIQIGPESRIAADPVYSDRIWTLDNTGVLRYVRLKGDAFLAKPVQAHSGGFQDLQVHSNGEVFTAGNDPCIQVWRFEEGVIQKVREFQHPNRLVSVALQEDRKIVASVDANGDIHLFDLVTGELRNSFAGAGNLANTYPVRTGRLAFSRSGKYLSAFGRGQDCTSIDVELGEYVSHSDCRIGDTGGLDICFSPKEELRFLTSSNAASGYEIQKNGVTANPLVPLGGSNDRIVDFAIPEDQQRIVGLDSGGNVVFYSPEHFVEISSIDTPVRRPSSIAIAASNSSLIVASKDGEIYRCVLEPRIERMQPSHILKGKVTLIDLQESRQPLHAGALEGLRSIQDRSGHLTELFIAGGVSEKSPSNRLYLFSQREQQWRFEPLRFEGDDEGPCERASLFLSPNGERMAIIRQGQQQLGAYQGRLIIAHEDANRWRSEIVQENGNAGFSPIPLFALNGSLQSVLHFDFEWQRWLCHQRDRGLKHWQRKTIVGNLGLRSLGVRDSIGMTHIITRNARGFDSMPPDQYIRIPASGEMQIEKAKGRVPYINKRNQLISYEPRNGKLWLKLPSGTWESIAELPLEANSLAIPTLDNQDQIWWATCMGDYLLVARRDLSNPGEGEDKGWQVFRVNLDIGFAKTIQCVCNRNASGVLEILLCQIGDPAVLGIVEVMLPD